MKSWWIGIIAAAQVLVLAFMAGQREWILRHGTRITLQTSPVDPNDAMRGAYVRLRYSLNQAPSELCRGELKTWLASTDWKDQRRQRDQVVYASLKLDERGDVHLESLDTHQPVSGLYLRGRVRGIYGSHIEVEYGIEALFASKQRAQAMEEDFSKKRAGCPLDVHIRIGANGTAVIESYEWEPLGLTLVFAPAAANAPTTPRPQSRAPRFRYVTAVLHNYSDHDIAVVDPADGRAFRLVPVLQGPLDGAHEYQWAHYRDFKVSTQPEDVVVLRAGAVHQVRLDFQDERWKLVNLSAPNTAPISMNNVDQPWAVRFRLEYTPPSKADAATLPHGELIYLRPIASRGFNSSESLD